MGAPALNPFLRAFFRSNLPSQCSPIHHHVLLVPTTEVLLTSRDRDTNASYADLSGSEEFLASHVLRVPGGVGPNNQVKDGSTFKETRGKAKQFTTANGRTVIVKDAHVYSNKGFKTLNQAQLLNDTIYYPDTFDTQQWLVYFITRPLIGTYEAAPITPALLPGKSDDTAVAQKNSTPSGPSSSLPRKKEVKSFGDLLNHFPMIARQMQPGLERLFKEFGKELEKPLPPVPSRSSRSPSSRSLRRGSVSSGESLPNSVYSRLSGGPNGFVSALELHEEEDAMRRSLETAVTAAIDLFQMVDKQQLSLLGATTDLTGPLVERMIERYISEQVHDSLLFPRLCLIRRLDDVELENHIRQMSNIYISQVGIPIGNGQKGKKELNLRLSKAVDIFKKMGVAGSPQEMLEILLQVQKQITMPDSPESPKTSSKAVLSNGDTYTEKQHDVLTINADTLVSLLLIVVIRAPVRHLQARLSYMRHFIFIDDVESGEMGYALSTFEAVLSYLLRDSGGLRRASRKNRELWQATKKGDVAAMRRILDPDCCDRTDVMDDADSEEDSFTHPRPVRFSSFTDLSLLAGTTVNGEDEPRHGRRSPRHNREEVEDGPLSHVFPFLRAPTPPPSNRPKAKKKVSMDTRSLSSSSAYSFRSRTNTLDSHGSGIEGDTSIEKLTRTQGPDGDSVLMMAVENRQDKALSYLLSLTDYYSPDVILEDCNNEGTTLFSAAVQIAHTRTTDVLLNYITDNISDLDAVRRYFAIQDTKGRCVAHYLFHQPHLIERIGDLVPWKLKDKNGQTPIFALCRSYDHDQYREMVDKAISEATRAQGDGQPLHVDEHIDNKGNTLLHIINDPKIATKLLYRCDSDVNAPNDKHFTPLMVASKYGRTDLVRVFFQDPRVDLSVKDVRGLTAVELAKDDDVRNRIDDLVLLSTEPGADGRMTTVVRSFFVEDGTIRLVVKSGAPSGGTSVTVTTCRRSLVDFENLVTWLAQEHPASWLPLINSPTSPFLIPSRPSRSILRDIQLRLDAFLKILLMHPTFSTHELVWEFFLVPDIDPTMLAERSSRKAELRIERLREEYDPIYDVHEVELFVQHARESVRAVHHSTKSILRRTNKIRTVSADLTDATQLANTAVHSLIFLPSEHLRALERFTKTLNQSEANPFSGFYYNMHAISTTITAMLTALNRPSTLISSMAMTQKTIDRHHLSIRRSDRWPLGLLDDARHRVQRDAQEKMDKAEEELRDLGRELRYTQQVVASELASWQEGRVKLGRKALKEFATRMVVTEKARLEGMRRAIRGLGLGIEKTRRGSEVSRASGSTGLTDESFENHGSEEFGDFVNGDHGDGPEGVLPDPLNESDSNAELGNGSATHEADGSNPDATSASA
jgi:hypothetical protein